MWLLCPHGLEHCMNEPLRRLQLLWLYSQHQPPAAVQHLAADRQQFSILKPAAKVCNQSGQSLPLQCCGNCVVVHLAWRSALHLYAAV